MADVSRRDQVLSQLGITPWVLRCTKEKATAGRCRVIGQGRPALVLEFAEGCRLDAWERADRWWGDVAIALGVGQLVLSQGSWQGGTDNVLVWPVVPESATDDALDESTLAGPPKRLWDVLWRIGKAIRASG
jgi:hypothetical protein